MPTSAQTQTALASLRAALEAPRTDGPALGNWRWTVRRRLAEVRDVLALERATTKDGWLAARSGTVLRERNALLTRVAAIAHDVLDNADVEDVRTEILRLLGDINHHLQRLTDLAYDDVEIELGGSE
ncbi:hypothetical protein [Nocardioides limicola]|uniref:hypothetical protein n=1 Tax=Nocardioides limicola TaxID=2803368 RepID=UPI00193B6071|nr:hypothetical protein [Nocardioides sp. DJM-14]